VKGLELLYKFPRAYYAMRRLAKKCLGELPQRGHGLEQRDEGFSTHQWNRILTVREQFKNQREKEAGASKWWSNNNLGKGIGGLEMEKKEDRNYNDYPQKYEASKNSQRTTDNPEPMDRYQF